ncbi:MAG: hypothetical protein GC129_01620 [Proteobacteria bacterium]|nr:hypothetical protein [Pseudomonadota bacterium]
MFQVGCAGAMMAGQQPAAQPYAAAEATQPAYAAPAMQAAPQMSPQAGMQGYMVPAGYPSYIEQQLQKSMSDTQERLDRVEKAMLRLDRRMQLVERNELHRMGDAGDDTSRVSTYQPASTGGSVPGSMEERSAMQSLGIGPAGAPPAESYMPASSPAGYQSGFRPVGNDEPATITSPLQAAPQQLASLADSPTPSTGARPAAASNVAVWTIRYGAGDDIWPSRDDLPASRDVVEALRNNTNVTLFARGPNPNGTKFRERVKAISRYLAKVSSLDTVPIAALPSPQMGGDTIEILATH